MYDAGKIITGLVIFLILFTFPVWYNFSQAAYVTPEPKLPKEKKACVESTQWMRENHMELLNKWRDEYVRKKHNIYVNSKGEKFVISLQNGCMKCHTNKKEFCDKCHNAVSVSPYCWDCHVAPEEVSHE